MSKYCATIEYWLEEDWHVAQIPSLSLQETHLLPKVKRTQTPQQKFRVNCVGGMLEGSDAGSRKITGSTPTS